MSRDTQKDLELCEKATPGPWNVWQEYTDRRCVVAGEADEKPDGTVSADWIADLDSDANGHDPEEDDANASFIAAAREALPYYITETLALRTELEQAKADNGALVDALKTLDEHIGFQDLVGEDVCAHYLGEEANPALQKAFVALSQPHPGDFLRARLADIEETLNLDIALVQKLLDAPDIPEGWKPILRAVLSNRTIALHGGKGDARDE